MLKKAAISAIVVLYFIVTSGVVMNIHYCMGSISSITFSHSEKNDDHCGKCGMKKTESHCCKEEFKTLKLNDLHQASNTAFELAAVSNALPVHKTVIHEAEQGISPVPLTDYFSPPPHTLNKVYLDVRVFRI